MKTRSQREKPQRGILITGASGGVGLAVAQHYLEKGWKVLLQYHSRKNELESLLRLHPKDALSVSCDFRNEKEIGRLVKSATNWLGNIDALINCVGVASTYAPVEELESEDWKLCLDINTVGALVLAKNVIPHLLRAKGTFLQISTNAIKFRGRNSIPYTTSKLAAEYALESFFKDHYSKGVRFNILRLGVIATGMKDRVKLYPDKQFRKRISLIPAGRCGTVEDAVRCCDFFVEAKNSFVCGTSLALTGGE